jgi:hypothetical protein
MRNLLHLCFCLHLTYIISGQNNLTVKVVDAITGDPIKHCIISSDDTKERFLTNEEGIATFKLSPDAVLQNYFYPGYERMSVQVTELVQSGIIALNKIPTKAADNNLMANEKKVLNRFTECRDLLKKAKIVHSKAYLVQSCFDQDEPIEILKYYYNSKLTGTRIVENDLKAGQFAFIADPDKIFLTLNNTKFFNETDWFTLKENFPATPFADLPNQLHKKFAFKRMSFSADKSDWHLTFEPFVQSGNSCSGEIFMDKDNKPQKIRLIARNTVNFPFEPIRDSDSISNVDFDLSYIFNPNQKDIQLELLELEYSFTIHSKTGTGIFTERNIRSKAVMHFYDFSQTFWIPNLIYNYPEMDAGYRTATLVPYDSVFWVRNNSMKWSE